MAKTTERMRAHIREYLDAFAERDDAFALDYENPAKSIDECCDFICTQVQKMGADGLDDDDVFGLAIHYYQEDDPGQITKGLSERCKVVVNRQVQLTEEEIAEARQRAKDELVEAEKRKIREQEKRKKEAAKAKAEEESKKLAEEGVLFNL